MTRQQDVRRAVTDFGEREHAAQVRLLGEADAHAADERLALADWRKATEVVRSRCSIC